MAWLGSAMLGRIGCLLCLLAWRAIGGGYIWYGIYIVYGFYKMGLDSRSGVSMCMCSDFGIDVGI
jgi:hypothetical protein